jgi:histidyl-tRNA synthetase
MTHPIPPGTRDILPDEMRELRKLSLALIDTFERFGYGEVATPTIEYDEVLARGEARPSAARPWPIASSTSPASCLPCAQT